MKNHSPLISVHRLRIACPKCGYKDNCAITEDRTRVYCRRVRSDYQGRDGGWLHILDDAAPPVTRVTVKPAPPSVPRADRHMLDTVFKTLLRTRPLHDFHHQDLIRRGLSVAQIAQGQFKSTLTRDEATEFIELLSPCEPLGVPGFYKDLGRWRLVNLPSGYFIPVLDRNGLIQGLQVRKDSVRDKDDPRYIWLSSASHPERGVFRPFGVSSGTPVHIQNPERIAETNRAIITEGALKAFIAAQFLSPDEGGIIALAGVSTFRAELGQQLKEAWPGLSHIAVAFDADWKTKKEVMAQLRRLIQILKASFESVEAMEWENEKGLDDYLTAEAAEKITEVA